jgi:hypothetical protein
VATAIAMALAVQFPVSVAYANSGFGDGVNLGNAPIKLPTFNANSPSGPAPVLTPSPVPVLAGIPSTTAQPGLPTLNAITQLPIKASSGKALRKFVDGLPGIGVAKKNNLNQYIPVAETEKWKDLNGQTTSDDYMEIAAVEYMQKMHSDLLNPTRLRGYVQLWTPALGLKGIVAKKFTPLGSTTVLDVVDLPHHLGPVINATTGTALRVKFVNLLPVGGKLFIPVDSTVTGAGNGPDGLTPYSQNRAVLHLVAGGLPWISAGTPHQWIAPAGETNPGVDPLTNAPAAVLDARGVSNHNVPDMADPGPGATTLYFPNDMSARFMFYHDRTSGLTRLNAYAGMEAGYFVTDATEKALITAGVIPAAADTIPLIIEDKTFVPADIAQQDARWNKTSTGLADPVWGAQSDLWFPHVYEANQDPQSALGTNPVGRFDYGPLFWPIFPAFDATPTGHTDDATILPTAYFDTPVINGTAYPTITVDPKAYRFRILNASVDRYLNLGLYKADTTPGIAPMLDANGNPIFNDVGVQQFFTGTEVKLVPALAIDAAGNPPPASGVAYDPACQCQYPDLAQNNNVQSSGPSRAWPVDARRGGVPDPLSVGPDIIAIGNDGGFLPNPVDIPSQPMTYEANRRSITVNNAYGYGLLLGPAERSDAIIDFSKYAGQTLIVYNDAPAPFPFSDERNDYYTGNPDMTATGGAYPTKPGYGPNTRTIMQIVVSSAAPVPYTQATAATAGGPTALGEALAKAYAASQAAPLVPAVAYNKAFKTNDPDIYAHIATGAAAQPTLDFTTTGPATLTLLKPTLMSSGGTINAAGVMVYNSGSGSGYDPLSPPRVVFNNTVNGASCLDPLTGVSASATATVDPVTRQVNAITNFMPGLGYTCLPTVSFVNTSTVKSLALLNGGAGYVNPKVEITGGDGTGALATAIVANGVLVNGVLTDGVITGFTITDPGTNYTVVPNVTITELSTAVPTTVAQANATLTPTLGVGAQVAVTATGGNVHSLKILPLAEQELFDNRGRYNYTGGVEMPFTNAINQTTVPLNYIDAATEAIADGETQVWKITVNGLFSNNLAFNLADVQLINRVGWDGTVKPPSSNELGWKSTVRMNPLEDVLVAVRANRAKVPFGLPVSARTQDPSKPVGVAGSEMGFTVGQGVTQLTSRFNREMNYNNEFFWGSTLLSNAENDFTRPIVFSPTVEIPAAPSNLTDPDGSGTLTWTDPTPAGQLAQAGSALGVTPVVPALAATLANPQNEIGFKIMQASFSGGVWTYTPFLLNGLPVTVPANVTRWTQPAANVGNTAFAVVAYNAAGPSAPSTPFADAAPVAPSNLQAAATAFNAVTLSWANNTTNSSIEISRGGVLIKTLPGLATSFIDYTVTAQQTYSYTITVKNSLGVATAGPVSATTPMMPVAAPTIVSALPNNAGTSVTLRWTDNATNETVYWVDVSVNGVAEPRRTIARSAAQGTQVGGALNTAIATLPGNVYSLSVTAVNVSSGATNTSAAATTTVDLSVPVLAAPATLTPLVQNATRAPFNWTAVAAPVTVPAITVSYVVQVNTNGAKDLGGALVWTNVSTTTTLAANPTIAADNTYQFRVVPQASRFNPALVVQGTPSAPLAVTTAPLVSTTPLAAAGAAGTKQIVLSWTNTSVNAIPTTFTVDRRENGVWVPQPAMDAASVMLAPGSYQWTDTLPLAGSYRYRVLASNGTLSSAYTATSNAVTAP